MPEQRFVGVPEMLNFRQKCLKRIFDLSFAIPGIVLTSPFVAIATLLATFDTKECGIFSQSRIGRGGNSFSVYKIRSMRSSNSVATTITTSTDPRITKLGSILRRTKVDELVQLWNVVKGDMSLVGPRPDMAGWADCLDGDDRIILAVRPGITGPASIYFKDEEQLLSLVEDPVAYNKEIIWPKKVQLNRNYIENWTALSDIKILMQTIFYQSARPNDGRF